MAFESGLRLAGLSKIDGLAMVTETGAATRAQNDEGVGTWLFGALKILVFDASQTSVFGALPFRCNLVGGIAGSAIRR